MAGRFDGEYILYDFDAESRRIARDQLGAAWAAYRKGKFSLTTVQTVPEPVDLTSAIRAAVLTTATHLTGPVLANYFDVNMGLSGMARLVADLRNTTAQIGWSRRFRAQPLFRWQWVDWPTV